MLSDDDEDEDEDEYKNEDYDDGEWKGTGKVLVIFDITLHTHMAVTHFLFILFLGFTH